MLYLANATTTIDEDAPFRAAEATRRRFLAASGLLLAGVSGGLGLAVRPAVAASAQPTATGADSLVFCDGIFAAHFSSLLVGRRA